jgi:hypothetical protein
VLPFEAITFEAVNCSSAGLSATTEDQFGVGVFSI